MITFKEYFELFVEMARPAKSFDDPMMNEAYTNSLKKFKQMNIHNANTYVIWDFIFRLLPDNLKTPDIIAARKKASGTYQRNFVLDFINKHKNWIDFNQLSSDMNNVDYIRKYINKEDIGNRKQGKINSQNASIKRMGFQDPLV